MMPHTPTNGSPERISAHHDLQCDPEAFDRPGILQ
jgi:hypothetical protein